MRIEYCLVGGGERKLTDPVQHAQLGQLEIMGTVELHGCCQRRGKSSSKGGGQAIDG